MAKIKTLREIKPNAGILAWYNRELKNIVKEIDRDIKENILVDYRVSQEMAMDSINDWIGHAMDLMVEKWSKKLLTLGDKISKLFATKSLDNYDRALKRNLKAHGFTVDLQLTDYTKETLKGAIAENTALIRSIGNQYLEKVQMHVWESVLSGLDAHQLAENLKHDFGVAARRAKIIARDQTAKANSAIEIARRTELGITEAIWVHSGGGKEPRQSHVRASGKRYEIAKGMLIDGEYIQPSQKINCRCVSKAVLPFNNVMQQKNVIKQVA